MADSDPSISRLLRDIRDGSLFTPYPGRWMEPIETADATVIAQDGERSSVLLAAVTGVMTLAKAQFIIQEMFPDS